MTLGLHIKTPGRELPELQPGQMRYVLAREGPYLERRTSMYTTTTPAKGPLLGLAPHQSQCVLHCGLIPPALSRMMLAFFRDAFQIHEGEAALVLLYHPARGIFRWHCPPQTVEVYRSWSGKLRSTDYIHYDMPLELPDGYIVFGDAHSHGSLPACPSGIDAHDEKYKDGLHIIVGKLDEPGTPDYHVDFVMDGHRFTIAPAKIFADLAVKPFAQAPPTWLRQITLKQPSYWSTYESRSYGDSYGMKKERGDYWNGRG